MAEDEMLTVADIAKRLKVRTDTVRVWLRQGQLNGIRLGNRGGWRVEPKEVDRFVATRAPAPRSTAE